MSSTSPQPRFYPVRQFFDNSGNLLSGGVITAYQAGTVTPKLLFTNEVDAANNTNGVYTITLGNDATAQIWFRDDTFLKLVLTDSQGGSLINGTIDNIPGEVDSVPFALVGSLTLNTATVLSAANLHLELQLANIITVTGTNTITSLGSSSIGNLYWITFTGALTLTYNATSLILPGNQNIAVAAGDAMQALSLGGGNFKVISYTTQNGSVPFITTAGNVSFTNSGSTFTCTSPSTFNGIITSGNIHNSVQIQTFSLVATNDSLFEGGFTIQPAGGGTVGAVMGGNGQLLLSQFGMKNTASVVASASSVSMPTQCNVQITGTTTITGFTNLAPNSIYILTFNNTLTFTNGASLICPGGTNLTVGSTSVVLAYATSTTAITLIAKTP